MLNHITKCMQSKICISYFTPAEIKEDPDIISEKLWMDAARFSRNGKVNLPNSYYWSETNPRWGNEVQKSLKYKLMIWYSKWKYLLSFKEHQWENSILNF